ncbi:aquaporin family protein [Streptomyces sp. 4.24]|uniref:aquaporin family protein n=1 Tax=Streptomyces tritrimontium TaxID=3406573 RepID=UPI003BB5BE15
MVGSGIQAAELTDDVALQLPANSTSTVFGLGLLIALLGPVSGGGAGVLARELAVYVPSQIAGAVAGAILVDAMFGEPLVKRSIHDRSAGNLLLGEVVATAGLILLRPTGSASRRSPSPRTSAPRRVLVQLLRLLRPSRRHHRPRLHRHLSRASPPPPVPAFIGAQWVGAVVGLALVAAIFLRGKTEQGRPAV